MNRKKIKFRILLIFGFLLHISSVHAQERLNLEQAVQIALENNYDIKLNKNEVEQAKNNVNRANAGMLPVSNRKSKYKQYRFKY
jgi:outer membrane protein